MIRCVPFASCYIYSPCGSTGASVRSRRLCNLLKTRDERFIAKYADRVREQLAAAAPLSGFVDTEAVLVPIPGCASREGGVASVADQLSRALLERGVGSRIWPCLRRVRAVQKSSTAVPGTRPSVACHYESFAIDPHELPHRDIVLIDDIITKGRTLLAAATRLQECFPGAQIRAFALVRTMGLTEGVSRLLEPCVGEIRWRWGDAWRTP